MRAITLCPNCQTQFFVTDAQLEKQKGKVRCGQCLHVFLATEHFISSMRDENAPLESEQASHNENADIVVALTNEDAIVSTANSREPSADEALATNAFTIEAPGATEILSYPISEANGQTNSAIEEIPMSESILVEDDPFVVGDYIPGSAGKKSKPVKARSGLPPWLKLLAIPTILLLFLLAVAQVAYFSRSTLASFYPNTKPYLVKMCAVLNCKISLPAQIEQIVIDDSDIQEDADYADLMRFSSTLLNRADFAQQFPNLELTLTDLEDEAKLRRVFTPQEYLASTVNIAEGMTPGREFKIKLAIQAKNTVVSGYRVSINY